MEISATQMQHLEKYTVLMYSNNSAADMVNEARRAMFTNGLKSLEAISSTQHALFQLIKQTLLIVS